MRLNRIVVEFEEKGCSLLLTTKNINITLIKSFIFILFKY
jgi:hypothetical protein